MLGFQQPCSHGFNTDVQLLTREIPKYRLATLRKVSKERVAQSGSQDHLCLHHQKNMSVCCLGSSYTLVVLPNLLYECVTQETCTIGFFNYCSLPLRGFILIESSGLQVTDNHL